MTVETVTEWIDRKDLNPGCLAPELGLTELDMGLYEGIRSEDLGGVGLSFRGRYRESRFFWNMKMKT